MSKEKNLDEKMEEQLAKTEQIPVVDGSVEEQVNDVEEEMTPEERDAFISDWNEQNKEFGHIREEKPTEEETKAVMEEYTEKVKEYNERQFEIADANNALRVARFLRDWNRDDVQWENNMWQGTIMFDQIMTQFINEFDKGEKKPLMVGYQTLVYLFLCMRNIKGVGLKSALHMQKINAEYVPILDTVGDFMTKYQEDGKRLELLQQKWSMFESGYFVELNGDKILEQ